LAAQTEAHFNLQLEKANREIEKLKFELHDQLETKHDQMKKYFASELVSVKQKYETSC